MLERAPNGFQMSVAYTTYRDWLELAESFETMAGYRTTFRTLIDAGEPTRHLVRQASLEYFAINGVSPAMGRLFDATENRVGGEPVAVLSHPIPSHPIPSHPIPSHLVNRFGARRDMVGQTIRLDDEPLAVVPDGFDLDGEERIYLPIEPWADNPSVLDRGNHQGLYVMARLRPEVSVD